VAKLYATRKTLLVMTSTNYTNRCGKQKISPRLLAPPYAVSRESAQLPPSPDAFPCQHPPTHHPNPGPKRSRPTFCQQHETDLGRAVACLADWPSAIRPRSIRTSILSSESSTHPPEPVSELTMVRKRKERVACSAQYHEEQERRRESQRTTVNLWRKGTRICVEGERRR
jgi:hypothetical protein